MRWLVPFLFAVQLQAATYYVATNGNDSAEGTYAAPWLSITNAATTATAGDTVIVLQGTYTNYTVTLNGTATADNRITFRGSNNPVAKAFSISKPYYTVDGFILNGAGMAGYSSVIYGAAAAHGSWILNNTFTNMPADLYCMNFPRSGAYPSNNASWLIVSNNTINFPDGINARAAIIAHGGTNQFRKNTFHGPNCDGEPDAFQVWGKDCIIADNVVENCGIEGAKGGDFWQVWGFRSWKIFYMPDLSAYNPQDGDSYTINGATRTWKTTVTDSATQIQIADKYANVTNMINQFDAYPISGVKRYPLEASSVGGTNCWRVLLTSSVSGVNLTHSEVGAWYLLEQGPPDVDSPVTTVENIVVERNKLINSYFQLCQIETYENDTNIFQDTTWRNNLIVSNRYGGAFGINKAKIYNNTFIRGATGTPFSFGSTKGSAYGTEIYNNAFIECGNGSSGQGWYAPGSGSGILYSALVNNNFACGYNGAAKDAYPPDNTARWGSYTWEANGINGGISGITNMHIPYPALPSVLIAAGRNMSTNFTDDLYGNTRAQWDIGCVGYDSNLLMRLDFSLGVTNGVIKDLTGQHNAWQMDSTNWITTTNGPNGLTAGEWHFVGTNPDGYRFSQYAAITNVPGTSLAKITNGTITAWVRWDTNYDGAQPFPERGDMIMDAGCDLSANAVNDPDTATNSWQFGFAKTITAPFGYNVVFQVTPTNDYNETQNILTYWPATVRAPTAWQWRHYAVVWNGGGYSTNYLDGVAVGTNLLGHPYLTVGGRTNVSLPGWICLGAMTHGGTAAWADGVDSYPNAFYFKGEMADVRIYNRALPGTEVTRLYTANAGAATDAVLPAANPNSTVLRGATAVGVTIR